MGAHPWAACLLLFTLSIGLAGGQQQLTAPLKVASAVQVLNKQLAAAVAAQRKRLNSTPIVEAQIVQEAPKAVLYSGDADLSLTGEGRALIRAVVDQGGAERQEPSFGSGLRV